MAITDYDTTASNNTTISGTNIDEGCSPAGINNAIRQVMADLADAAAVRTHLNTVSKSAAEAISGAWTFSGNPVFSGSPDFSGVSNGGDILAALGLTGVVMPFAMATAPTGWLTCDGSAVSRTTYAALFTAIGTTYGTGDGSTTFNLPDLRGEFIRGWDNGAGNDPDAASRTDRGDGTTGDNIGTKQSWAVENATGLLGWDVNSVIGTGVFSETGAGAVGGATSGSSGTRVDFDLSRQVQTSTEARPRNVAMLFCIKT